MVFEYRVKMETAGSSETSMSICQATLYHIPQKSQLSDFCYNFT